VSPPTRGEPGPGPDLGPRTRAGATLLLAWFLLVNLVFYGHLAQRYAERIRPAVRDAVIRLR
jgi:hypothetical protein